MPKWPLRSRKGQERQRQRNNHQTQQQTAADTTRVVVSKRPGALHKAELHLATLNVQTWHGSRYSIDDTWAPFAAATVVSAATAGVNVLAVQECRIPGSDRVSIPGPQGGDAWTLVYSGVKHHRQFINGVGFLLDAKTSRALHSYHAFSDRVIAISVALKDSRNLYVVSAYAPTVLSDDSFKDQFYADLLQAIEAKPAAMALCLMGDFNATCLQISACDRK